jgi:hypothetical protein
MTTEEVKALLGYAKAATGMIVDANTVLVWSDMLFDMPFAEGLAALRAFLAEDHRKPTIADIRRRAAARVYVSIDFASAWGQTQREIRRVGRYGVPKFDHPAVTAVVDAMGWINLCEADRGDATNTRAQFRQMLEGHQEIQATGANSVALEEHRRTGQLTAGDAILRLGNGVQ